MNFLVASDETPPELVCQHCGGRAICPDDDWENLPVEEVEACEECGFPGTLIYTETGDTDPKWFSAETGRCDRDVCAKCGIG